VIFSDITIHDKIQGDRKVAHIKLNVVVTFIADIIIVSPTARW
jgi:hypothetical protein